MVAVYTTDTLPTAFDGTLPQIFGELIADTPSSFTIHSHPKPFSKQTHAYLKIP